VPLTLNEAMCDHHRKHCPKSEELDRECGKVGPLHLTCAVAESSSLDGGCATALHVMTCLYCTPPVGMTMYMANARRSDAVEGGTHLLMIQQVLLHCFTAAGTMRKQSGARWVLRSAQLFAGGEGCGRAGGSTEEFAGWDAVRRPGQEVPRVGRGWRVRQQPVSNCPVVWHMRPSHMSVCLYRLCNVQQILQ
jgi:hypothetical protein